MARKIGSRDKKKRKSHRALKIAAGLLGSAALIGGGAYLGGTLGVNKKKIEEDAHNIVGDYVKLPGQFIPPTAAEIKKAKSIKIARLGNLYKTDKASYLRNADPSKRLTPTSEQYIKNRKKDFDKVVDSINNRNKDKALEKLDLVTKAEKAIRSKNTKIGGGIGAALAATGIGGYGLSQSRKSNKKQKQK